MTNDTKPHWFHHRIVRLQEWAATKVPHNIFSVIDMELEQERAPRLRARFLFAWYDLWVGVFIDRKTPSIYVFPIPCVGFQIFIG